MATWIDGIEHRPGRARRKRSARRRVLRVPAGAVPGAIPHFTIHGVNDTARTLWVEHVMANPSRDVMAVQTLRNFTMSATFMASSAALLDPRAR